MRISVESKAEIKLVLNQNQKSVLSVSEDCVRMVSGGTGSSVTCLAEWKVVFGIVESQHWVVVSGHPCLRRRTLIQ